MEAVIFIGIQAAGKSTFYKQNFSDTHIRLNRDMLKTRHRETVLLRACLEAKQPFVVDNMNATRESRAPYIAAARAAGFRLVGYYFQTSVADALRRNAARTGKQLIPVKGILGTHAKLQPPSPDEGFAALFVVRLDACDGFNVSQWPEPTG
jgi:predicted kinase